MKLLPNSLPVLALALVPALAAATIVPAPDALARLAERESLSVRLEGTWIMDVARTESLAAEKKLTATKLEFRREPLVVQLALTASPRMALLPIFDGGIVNDGYRMLPYVLVDRGEAFELMVFHPGEGTSFAWADVLPVHLMATADGPRLFLGGSEPRRALGVYAEAPEVAAQPIVVRIQRVEPAIAADATQ
ncbi:MAG: hypothetical protein HZA53_11070 [Planctomycetes bacterium]|nr:hypothetical protein [Planctomycetota bacterium]